MEEEELGEEDVILQREEEERSKEIIRIIPTEKSSTIAASQKVSPGSASGTNTIKYQMYPTPENARPGQELPHKSMIIEQTLYAQKQLAETSDNPKDETKFLTNQMEGNFGMK